MKYHTTQREARNSNDIVLSVSYAMLQNVLKCENPIAYNSGKDGWNFDLYFLDSGISLVTGHRGTDNASTHKASDIEGLNEALRTLENDSYDEDFKEEMSDKLTAIIKQYVNT